MHGAKVKIKFTVYVNIAQN